ncbi:MAG: hypothetical protein ACFCVC_20380 [Acidimicrobiia bacterium]
MTEDVNRMSETVGEQIHSGIEKLFGPADPGTVYSEPQVVGDDLVITAAAWERAGGFGFGVGTGNDDKGGRG